MTTIPLETGNIVHDVIEILLKRLKKTEEDIHRERFYDFTRRKTAQYCMEKRFAELFYNEIEKVDPEKIYSDVKSCLDNLLESRRFSWLSREAIQNRESWIIEPGGYGETRINGMKAYCKVDFLFPLDSMIYILDWKTGKRYPEKHSRQLKGYSAWASFHFEKDPVDIVPIIAYLRPDYSEVEVVNNEFDLEEFTELVERETREMYSFCTSIEENIPKDKELFLKTRNRLYCDYCNFRMLCL